MALTASNLKIVSGFQSRQTKNMQASKLISTQFFCSNALLSGSVLSTNQTKGLEGHSRSTTRALVLLCNTKPVGATSASDAKRLSRALCWEVERCSLPTTFIFPKCGGRVVVNPEIQPNVNERCMCRGPFRWSPWKAWNTPISHSHH